MNANRLRRLARTFLLLPLLLLFVACGDEKVGPVIPTFDDPSLKQGRGIWMQVCKNCHLTGVAGAPAINDSAAWAAREAKGKEALYARALNGIPAANGWSMPPKGGMARLSAAEVRLAVDYMLAAQARIGAGVSKE